MTCQKKGIVLKGWFKYHMSIFGPSPDQGRSSQSIDMWQGGGINSIKSINKMAPQKDFIIRLTTMRSNPKYVDDVLL